MKIYDSNSNSIKNKKSIKLEQGFSVIEIILASAIFLIFSSGTIFVVLQGFGANRLGSEETSANQYASEGLEAVRSIKNQAFTNLVNTAGTGIARNGSNVWSFSGSSNTFGKFTRVLTVADVQRDASGNIVASGGSVDPSTKKVTSTASWDASPTRNNSVALATYLMNWRASGSGVLVYGDGGTTTDTIRYRILDRTGVWNTAASTSDVDSGTTNKALRAARIYASSTRDEKILISRHYNGSAQFIYAQVFNGTTWGTALQLSTWTAATFLDVLNFDGTYLSNGNFMVVYSDNTVIPKARVWNGTSWAAQTSLTTLGASQIPNYIVMQARPGSNEAMAAFFTQGSSTTTANTITQYWNGSAWSAITTHAAASIANTKRYVDFDWSPNSPTTGILIYADTTTDKTMTTRLCTASAGVCTWGTAANSGTAQVNNMGALNLEPRPNANEYQACNKDSAATPLILCNKITFTGTTPTISAPVTIAAATDTGIQRSFDIDWEAVAGDPMIAVYSDNTAVPKLKKYTPGTSTWDGAATTIATTGFTPGVFKVIRVIPREQTDDTIALMSDANLDLYSVVWNGTTGVMNTAPAGYAISRHGINGSATTDYWFDFAWDKF